MLFLNSQCLYGHCRFYRFVLSVLCLHLAGLFNDRCVILFKLNNVYSINFSMCHFSSLFSVIYTLLFIILIYYLLIFN